MVRHINPFEVRCGSAAERAAELQVLLSVDIFLFYYILQCRAFIIIRFKV